MMKYGPNGEKFPDPDAVPFPTLERLYWRRKAPHSLLFYLKYVSRLLMLAGEDKNYLEKAAECFENLLKQREEELKKLPEDPYLNKLLKKAGLESARRPSEPEPMSIVKPVRCARCGRWLNPNAPQPCPGPPSAANVITHVEADEAEQCTVVALPNPPHRGPFGNLAYQVTHDREEGDPLDPSFLSLFVDF